MAEILSDKWLSEQLALCEKATKGPWEYDGMHNEIVTPTADADQYWLIMSECRSAPDQISEQDQFGHMYDANFAFLAAVRIGYPLVLRKLQEIRQRRCETCDFYYLRPDGHRDCYLGDYSSAGEPPPSDWGCADWGCADW